MSDKRDTAAKKPAFINANRRGFMQGAALASGVAATGVTVAADSPEVQADQAGQPVNGKGYELTDHIRKYYKRARF
ncbi:MAG: twin-arginine translocation signal domain-containing protein [Granulosicoccus sp.]